MPEPFDASSQPPVGSDSRSPKGDETGGQTTSPADAASPTAEAPAAPSDASIASASQQAADPFAAIGDEAGAAAAVLEKFVRRLKQPETPRESSLSPEAAQKLIEALRATTAPADASEVRSQERRRPLPQTIGRYRVKRQLGVGGMGTVYEAIQPLLERSVAVKVLPTAFAASDEAVARFAREIRAIGSIEHEGIVRAYDAGLENDLMFLVMERVDGFPLNTLAGQIEKSMPLPVGIACEIVRQAAVAIDAAHQAGLVHRDLKPSNLILDRNGVVKVLDLGLAQLDPRLDDPAAEITQTGQVMGTVEYMAPEHADLPAPGDSNEADCDETAGEGFAGVALATRSDVYSLGATLYRLLCGQPPYPSSQYRTPLARLNALVTVDPAPASALRPKLPTEVARIVQRAMERVPDDRFDTAGELAEALRPNCDPRGLRLLAEAMPASDDSLDRLSIASLKSGADTEVIAQGQTNLDILGRHRRRIEERLARREAETATWWSRVRARLRRRVGALKKPRD